MGAFFRAAMTGRGAMDELLNEMDEQMQVRGLATRTRESYLRSLLSIEGAGLPVTITVDPTTCPGVEPLVLPGFFRLAGTKAQAVPF